MNHVEHIVLAGGGLQNALVALALDATPNPPRVTLIERDERLGGEHTWCFFDTDVADGGMGNTGVSHSGWMQPLVTHRWDDYTVAFPEFIRHVPTAYCRTDSQRVHDVVTGVFERRSNWRLLTGTAVTDVTPGSVRLDDGRQIESDLTIVATGPGQHFDGACAGYQKFLGLQVRLAAPHGLQRPLLMDACVEQIDGLRFVYVLPLDERTLLVEDTRFSDGPRLDVEQLAASTLAYCRKKGWELARVDRVETGVLPLPWAEPQTRADAIPDRPFAPGAILYGGYGGGWFHPVTGYSVPAAARFAEAIASGDASALRDQAGRIQRQVGIGCALNRVLFRHYDPQHRWYLMRRFYQRPREVIERFYSMNLGSLDLLRIVVGTIPRKLRLLPRPAENTTVRRLPMPTPPHPTPTSLPQPWSP